MVRVQGMIFENLNYKTNINCRIIWQTGSDFSFYLDVSNWNQWGPWETCSVSCALSGKGGTFYSLIVTF